MRSIVLSAILGVLLTPMLASQNEHPAPQPLLESLGLAAGTVQDLTLFNVAAQPVQVRVKLAGTPHTLQLVPNDVRANGYQLLVEDEHGIRPVPAGPSTTYQGTVEGHPGSAVAAAIVDGQLEASIRIGGGIWNVQPATDGMPLLPRNAHVVYSNDQVAPHYQQCLALVAPQVVQLDTKGPGSAPDGVVTYIAELALDCAAPYYQINGSSVTNTQNAALASVNAVNTIYTRDVDISHTVVYVLVRTTTGPLKSKNPSTLLSQLRSDWNANRGSVARDVVHLFTGFPNSGTIGIAYVGVVCNLSYAYGISWYDTSSAVRTAVTAHELGHNWNAQHCSGGGCNIMCAFIGGCSGNITSFGAGEQAQIESFRNTRGCLTIQ